MRKLSVFYLTSSFSCDDNIANIAYLPKTSGRCLRCACLNKPSFLRIVILCLQAPMQKKLNGCWIRIIITAIHIHLSCEKCRKHAIQKKMTHIDRKIIYKYDTETVREAAPDPDTANQTETVIEASCGYEIYKKAAWKTAFVFSMRLEIHGESLQEAAPRQCV